MSTLTTDPSAKGTKTVKVVDLILRKVEAIKFSSLSAEEIYEIVMGVVQMTKPHFKYFPIFVDFLQLAKWRIIEQEKILQLERHMQDNELVKFRYIELFPIIDMRIDLSDRKDDGREVHRLLLSRKGEFITWAYVEEFWEIRSEQYSKIAFSALEVTSKKVLIKTLAEHFNWFFKTFIKQLSGGVKEKRRKLMELDNIVGRVTYIRDMVEKDNK